MTDKLNFKKLLRFAVFYTFVAIPIAWLAK